MTVMTRSAEYDQGLRSYMIGIYNYMILGLLVSAASAYFAEASGFTAYMMTNTVLFISLLIAPFALIFAMAFAGSMGTGAMMVMYVAFTFIEGLTLSVVLTKYTGASILTTFLATCGVFAGLSLWGYTTKRNLSGLGSFFIGALFGLILLMLINIVFPSPALNLFVGAAGVLLFAGLIAYDTQKLKDEYTSRAFIGGSMHKAMIWGALDLYLDFLNMFLFLLRFLGTSSDD